MTIGRGWPPILHPCSYSSFWTSLSIDSEKTTPEAYIQIWLKIFHRCEMSRKYTDAIARTMPMPVTNRQARTVTAITDGIMRRTPGPPATSMTMPMTANSKAKS